MAKQQLGLACKKNLKVKMSKIKYSQEIMLFGCTLECYRLNSICIINFLTSKPTYILTRILLSHYNDHRKLVILTKIMFCHRCFIGCDLPIHNSFIRKLDPMRNPKAFSVKRGQYRVRHPEAFPQVKVAYMYYDDMILK